MKKVVVLFLMITSFCLAQKQTLFLDKDYYEVVKQSKTENKPIVIMFYATWCAHCNKMKNEIFIDNEVINYYNNTFICMAINSESMEGVTLKTKFKDTFKVKSYPTFVFFDTNENLLGCISGEFKKDNFIAEGKKILLPENQYNTIKSKFEADVTNADNCLDYITMIKNIGFNPTETAEKYLNAIPPKDMISELNWRVIANGISDIESKQVGFIVAQKDAFAKVASLTRVDKKMVRLVEDNLYQPANFGDTLQYNKRRPIAASFQIQKVDSLLFRFDILIAEKTGDWKKYQKTADAGVEKYVWKDSNTLVEIGRNYAFFVDDKKEIQNSISWIKQAITLGETMEKYVLITKLYIKQNDYKNALEYAKKGKDLGVSFNWKTEEMDTLLTEIKKHAK